MKPGLKQQVHRSLTLWSGILVMGFLAWAWRDSLRFWTCAWHAPYELEHAGGGVCFSNRDSALYGRASGTARLPLSTSFSQVRVEKFPGLHFIRAEDLTVEESEALVNRMHEGKDPSYTMEENLKLALGGSLSGGRWVLFVPHWVMLLACAGMWAGLFVWRARRRRKAGREHRTSNAQH